jgi:predicted transcriptional regulator of viral defense system
MGRARDPHLCGRPLHKYSRNCRTVLTSVVHHLYTVTAMYEKVEQIGDLFGPDVLYRLAERQAGYLTARQAVATGMPRSTLAHHARPGGRLQPVSRGVYRLRNFPPSPHEHIVAGWLRTPPSADAVVSHQSALELHDLSDIIADQIHVSVPRNRRRKAVPGLTLHVTQLPILPNERREILGVAVTSPERTILDVLREGGPNEQIELAIAQALRRGLSTRRRLALTAEAFPKTSQHHLAGMLEKTSP